MKMFAYFKRAINQHPQCVINHKLRNKILRTRLCRKKVILQKRRLLSQVRSFLEQ